MSNRAFLGGEKSKLRLVLIVLAFVLLLYFIVAEERYILIVPGVLGALAMSKYLSDTYFSKDESEGGKDSY